jgi:phage baseplate assembly protein W
MSTGDYPQVGIGWAFPPTWELQRPEGGPPLAPVTLEVSDGHEHITQALVIHVRTLLGSRVMRPEFGADADRYVFEPRTSAVCHRLADDVRRALVVGEPRVIVDRVLAEPAGPAEDRIDVTVEYRIDRHRRTESLVIPYYAGGQG